MFRKGTENIVLRRPLFIAAMIQLIAACVSFWCMGIGQQDMLSVVLVTSFAGVLLYGILALYIVMQDIRLLFSCFYIISHYNNINDACC